MRMAMGIFAMVTRTVMNHHIRECGREVTDNSIDGSLHLIARKVDLGAKHD